MDRYEAMRLGGALNRDTGQYQTREQFEQGLIPPETKTRRTASNPITQHRDVEDAHQPRIGPPHDYRRALEDMAECLNAVRRDDPIVALDDMQATLESYSVV